MDILVHVTAPATVHHDKRQLGLAQAIIDFQPVSVTNVMSCEDEDNRDKQASESAQVIVADNGSSEKAKARNSLKRSRSALAPSSNPPYRNPYHGAQPLSRLQTPLTSARPRTAPEFSPSTVQVPQTSRERRRTQSDSFLSTTSRVTNSQENQTPDVDLDPSSDAHISSPLEFKANIVLSLSQTSLEDQPPAKRPRLDHEALTPPPGSETSTATPSQPFEDESKASQPAPDKAASIVSISSDETQRHAIAGHAIDHRPMEPRNRNMDDTRESTVSNPFPAIDDLPLEVAAPQPAVGDGTFSSHITPRLQELMEALPLHRLFKPLRVTRDVKVLERGYWLLEIVIAPDEVVGQARTSPTKEAAINKYTERFSGSTAEERLARFWQTKEAGKMSEYDYGHDDEALGKWTEAEFLTFWNSFSEFVSMGHAGWAVRMVRDDLHTSPAPAGNLRKLRVRIFTWGEVIGHIFLATWLFSGKLSVRIPMKWIAGDGLVVVEMSGKKKFTGNLPPWVRKGPPGEGGFWGVSSDS